MKIAAHVQFSLQFSAEELSQHIALLDLGRTQLSAGPAYTKATELIESLQAMLDKYQRISG